MSYENGINAGRIAIDFIQSKLTVTNKYKRKIHLSKGGGMAVMLTPKKDNKK